MKTKNMKIMKSSFFLVLMIFSFQAFSQVKIGVQAGMGASTQSALGNIVDNDNLCCGLNVGFLSQYEANKWLSIKSGVFYKEKGSQIKEVPQKSEFNYLQIPLMAEFSAPVQTGKKSRIFFAAGPYFATCLKAELEQNEVLQDVLGEVNKTDAGLSLEWGLKLPMADHKLLLSLNYDMGMTKVYKNNDNLKNKNLSFNIGFLF